MADLDPIAQTIHGLMMSVLLTVSIWLFTLVIGVGPWWLDAMAFGGMVSCLGNLGRYLARMIRGAWQADALAGEPR